MPAYQTAFHVARPLLQRYLTRRAAQYAADYLNRRRAPAAEPEPPATPAEPADLPPAVEPEPAPEAVTVIPVPVGYSGSDLFWYTVSGVLFGAAMGVILAYALRQED
ncbi:MAG: hypothetical protein D6784_04495 [Chloroflexi bacterium]|nr:MAG: hypothetical protein D6784_04495 [Chloroflexota bacterium]